MTQQSQWTPIVILVDADYLGQVASDFRKNFEPLIGRSIPEGDLYHWLDCVALDGGLIPGNHEIQVHFIYSQEHKSLKSFTPAHLKNDIDGVHFKDNVGDFSLFTFPLEEVVSFDEFFLQSLSMLAESDKIEKLLVVGNCTTYGEGLEKVCLQHSEKDITVFSMQTPSQSSVKHEILGYSLMSAMGIKSEELR